MSTGSGHANVLCVGRLYCDLIFTDLPRMPTAGTEVFAGGMGLHAGGGAAITAGHLSALGHGSKAVHRAYARAAIAVCPALPSTGLEL